MDTAMIALWSVFGVGLLTGLGLAIETYLQKRARQKHAPR